MERLVSAEFTQRVSDVSRPTGRPSDAYKIELSRGVTMPLASSPRILRLLVGY